jgi:hypothetical protein
LNEENIEIEMDGFENYYVSNKGYIIFKDK